MVDWIDLSDVKSFCVANPDKVFPEFDFDQPAELQLPFNPVELPSTPNTTTSQILEPSDDSDSQGAVATLRPKHRRMTNEDDNLLREDQLQANLQAAGAQ